LTGDVEASVERDGAPQRDLWRPLDEARDDSGAVPAVPAGQGPVEAAGDGNGWGHALTIPREGTPLPDVRRLWTISRHPKIGVLRAPTSASITRRKGADATKVVAVC
jgi:hypothetical protein